MNSVFFYPTVGAFLKGVLERHPSEGPLSLVAWTRRLGLRSPRSVAMVIKGQRRASHDLLARVSRDLKLPRNEARYLAVLASLERAKAKSSIEVEHLLAELQQLKPKDVVSIPAASFALIAQWHHLVLKRLVATPGFEENLEKIRGRLRKKLTQGEIKESLALLMRLGILQRDENQRLRLHTGPIETTFDVPSSAIKTHHRQMLARASEALVEQPVGEREILGTTLWFKRDRMAEAKEDIRRFNREFREKYGSDPADDVYQLNMQFFAHTTNETGKV